MGCQRIVETEAIFISSGRFHLLLKARRYINEIPDLDQEMCPGLCSVNSLLLLQQKICQLFCSSVKCKQSKISFQNHSLQYHFHKEAGLSQTPSKEYVNTDQSEILHNKSLLSIKHSHGTQLKDDGTVFLHWKHLTDVNGITICCQVFEKRKCFCFCFVQDNQFLCHSIQLTDFLDKLQL